MSKKVKKEKVAEQSAPEVQPEPSKTEVLKAQLESVIDVISEKRDALNDFLKANKLKKGKDYSTDKKVGKEYKKLNEEIDALVKEKSDIQKQLGTVKKPKGQPGGSRDGQMQWSYPEEINNQDLKKRYRAKMRSKLKKGEPSAEVIAKVVDEVINWKPSGIPFGGSKKKAEKTEEAPKAEKTEKKEKKAKKESQGVVEEKPAKLPPKKAKMKVAVDED